MGFAKKAAISSSDIAAAAADDDDADAISASVMTPPRSTPNKRNTGLNKKGADGVVRVLLVNEKLGYGMKTYKSHWFSWQGCFELAVTC